MKPYTLFKNYLKYSFTIGFILGFPSGINYYKENQYSIIIHNHKLYDVIKNINSTINAFNLLAYCLFYGTKNGIFISTLPITFPLIIYYNK